MRRIVQSLSLAAAVFGVCGSSAMGATAAHRADLFRSGLVIPAQARQPSRNAAPAQPPASADTLEGRFWAIIKDSNEASDFQTYLDAYPNGKFAAQARARLQQIQGGKSAPASPAAAPREAPASTPAPSPAAAPPRPTPVAPPPPPAPSQAAPLVIGPPQQAEGGSTPETIRDCPQCPALVLIKPGTFTMGSTEAFPFEGPPHSVTIRKPFYLGQREVTFDEWDFCVKDGGCTFSPNDRGQGRGSRPVTNLSWSDTQQFLAWLTKKTGKTYRLPTESEWEYAARGGTTTTYFWGRAMEKNRANCSGCDAPASSGAVATGSFPPNPWGLLDMAGNAAEWVEDCWHDSYRGAPADGSAWTSQSCQERVLRGGSFGNDPRYVRSASRFKYDFDVRYYTNGFRVAREP